MIKIAIAQVQSSTNKKTNRDTALALIDEAKNKHAEAIAFPEFLMAFSPASQSAAELSLLAEAVDGPFIAAMRQAAQSAGISVLAPIYETCAVKDRVYDSAVWIDAGGNIASVYRKLHLYDAFGFKESDKFHPGDAIAPLVKSANAQVGTMICYDLRFPEMARMLALARRQCFVCALGLGSGRFEGGALANHDQSARPGERLLCRRAQSGG